MKWTIEKIRELPPDNWFGVKRVGSHAWCLEGNGMTIYTGDGGVVEYLNTFNKQTEEFGKGLLDQEAKIDSYQDLTYEKLEQIVKDVLFNGMDKD